MNYSDLVLSGAGMSLTVSDGEIANSITVRNSASLKVLAGGRIESTTAYNSVTVSNAGSALSTFLSGGTMIVSNGGIAADVNVGRNARLVVSNGGVATGVSVHSEGNIRAEARGGDQNTLITGTNENGDFYLSGGVASNFILNQAGFLTVSNGGSADTVEVRNNGCLTVLSGGRASGIIHRAGGYVRADVYGNDPDTAVYGTNENGEFSLVNGIASDFILYDGDAQQIFDGGIAYHTLVNVTGQMGCQFVWSGAVASATSVFRNGIMNVYENGIVRDTVVYSGASMVANDGAIISGATVNGLLHVTGGATGEDESGGNAVISDVTIGATGKLTVAKSATFSGKISVGGLFTANVGVSVADGSTIDFDISGIYPGTGALVNDLSRITGTPDYTITVSGLQLAGDYALAGGAADFDRTVTVSTNTGNELGMLSVGGELEYGGFTYALSLDSGTLWLTIHGDDDIPPEAPTAIADVTTPTNQKVKVTATFSEDTALKQYSFDNETWSVYDSGVVMSANGTVFFRGIDAAGNYSEVTEYNVTNIDKTAPAAPTVKSSNTAATNKNVTITAIFSDDSEVKQYSVDNQNWEDYTGAISVGANGTYFFRGIDAAGNKSTVARIEVTNIDKVAPNAPTVKASTTKLTNQNVTVTATFSDDSAKKQYSTDKKTWKTYSKALTVSANGTYYFRGVDEAGNASKLTSIKVANIDKAAPTVKVSTTKPTNKNITITATFTKGAAKKQYSTDKKTWKTYSTALTVSANGTYYFRGVDKNNKASTVVTVKVANIDKVAPNAPTVKASTTKATNQNVTITATFSKDSAKKQYSTDNKTWKTYSKALSATKNGTYYFRGVDEVGNISKVTTVKVANIDKVAPNAPTVKASTTKATNKNITVTATFSKDSSKKQYSTDKKTWKTYSKALSVGKNATYYFRGIDAAGNISKVTALKVANIDKTAPAAPTATFSNVSAAKITVTGKFSKDTVKREVSWNKKTWLSTGRSSVTVGKNSVFYVRVSDAAGNVSKATTISVMNLGNNNWNGATVLTGDTLAAIDGSFDKLDYYNVGDVSKLMLDMEQGKVQVSFYDKNKKEVKVSALTMADGSVKKNVSSLKLAAGNGTTDKFTIAALDDAVKYLKIESADNSLDSYRLAKLA